MKVLMATGLFHPAIGGTETQARLLAGTLVRRGVAVEVVTQRKDGWAREETVDGARVVRLPSPDLRPIGKYVHLAALVRHLECSRWDVVHAHGAHGHAWAAVRAARRLGRPSLVKFTNTGERFDLRVLGGWFRAGRRMGRGILEADCFLVQNRAMRAEVEAAGADSARIAELPNAVDAAIFHPAEQRERERLRAAFGMRGFAALFVGSLLAKKHPQLLVDGFARFTAGHQGESSLWVAGEGPLRYALEASAPRSVRFLGARTDVADLLRAADCFVLPSRHEGMPNALLEAMATGLPCIASDIPPHCELLDRSAGLLFEARPDALANALARVAADGGLAAALGAAARRRVEERYAVDAAVDRLVGLYEDLLRHRTEAVS